MIALLKKRVILIPIDILYLSDFFKLYQILHCCIEYPHILQEKMLLQTYTAFTCRIYNKKLRKKYLTPEIEMIYYLNYRFQELLQNSCNINSRLPLFQGSKAVYKVILPVIQLYMACNLQQCMYVLLNCLSPA